MMNRHKNTPYFSIMPELKISTSKYGGEYMMGLNLIMKQNI